MKASSWIIIGIVAVALVAIVALVPAVWAQGPLNNNNFGPGNGPVANNNSGWGMGPGRMFNNNGEFGPGSRLGMMGRGGGMMGRGGWNNDGWGGPMMGQGFGNRGMMGRGGAWGGPQNSLVAVTAEVLGLDRTELVAQLQAGQTLAEVITAHGVALDNVIDEFLAPRLEWLNQQVADGDLTQEQADAILASMKAHVTEELNEEWSPRGPGQGQGFVDEDGDGVCDNAGAGRGLGRGMGRGFVDEDGNGVCDHYENAAQ